MAITVLARYKELVDLELLPHRVSGTTHASSCSYEGVPNLLGSRFAAEAPGRDYGGSPTTANQHQEAELESAGSFGRSGGQAPAQGP